MPDFLPGNDLELALRRLLGDKHTPVWTFLTPLGAARLWTFAKNYPELDGSDRVAPEGQNPPVIVFDGPEDASYIGMPRSLPLRFVFLAAPSVSPGHAQTLDRLR